MERRSVQPPVPLLWAALCGLAGVLLADALEPSWALCLAFSSGTLSFFYLQPTRAGACACVVALVASAHVWRHQLCPSRVLAERLSTNQTEIIEVTALVESPPSINVKSNGKQSALFQARIERISPFELWVPNCEVLVHWAGPSPNCGDRIKARGILKRIPAARNPGEFDRASYYCREYIWSEVFVRNAADGDIIEHAAWNGKAAVAGARKWLSNQLLLGIEDQPQIHALISSMVLGMESGSLEDMHQIFQDLGAVHLFAVSGLNLSMLAALSGFLLSLIPTIPGTNAIATAAILKGYAIVTGLSASCSRALVMALLSLGIHWVKRPAVVLNTVGAAGLLLLIVDGNTAFKLGFQLSFGLVLSLIYLSARIAGKSRQWFAPDQLLPQRLWTPAQRCTLALGTRAAQILGAACVAWLASLPWNCFVFHQISMVSILVNLVAVPISFVNLVLGFMSLLCFALGPVPLAINRLNAQCASLLLEFVTSIRLHVGPPFAIGSPLEPAPSLMVFDLLEGAAVALREGDRWWLLDCGNDKAALAIVTPALCRYGVNTLSGLVLSHGDTNHIGGALKVWERFRPVQIFDSTLKSRSVTRKRIHQDLMRSERGICYVRAGDVPFNDSRLQVEILYPPVMQNGGKADDHAIVLRWRTPEWTVLYTSDAGFPTEQWLLKNTPERLRSDVWIRGAHKTEETGGGDFVRAVAPRLIVVSGLSRYGSDKSHDRWAERWGREGIPVWLQTRTGAVLGWTAPSIRLRPFLGGDELSWQPDRRAEFDESH